jgi:hypothetical protein
MTDRPAITFHVPIGVRNADTFQDDLDNHAAWPESGEAMLAVADVIWVELVRLSAEHRREIDAMDAAAKAGNPPPGTQWLDGMPVFTQPRAKLIPLMGCSDAYLMSPGYAVENFLKALRVKRLSISGTRAAYAKGPKDRSQDRIPVNHEYLDFAREELGVGVETWQFGKKGVPLEQQLLRPDSRHVALLPGISE